MASADPFEGLYGNTVTSVAPDGRVYVYYFNKDGSFESHYPAGREIRGTFVWRDAHTACFTILVPPPAKGESGINCRPFPATHHIGDTWTEKDADGILFTNTVISGRH